MAGRVSSRGAGVGEAGVIALSKGACRGAEGPSLYNAACARFERKAACSANKTAICNIAMRMRQWSPSVTQPCVIAFCRCSRRGSVGYCQSPISRKISTTCQSSASTNASGCWDCSNICWSCRGSDCHPPLGIHRDFCIGARARARSSQGGIGIGSCEVSSSRSAGCCGDCPPFGGCGSAIYLENLSCGSYGQALSCGYPLIKCITLCSKSC